MKFHLPLGRRCLGWLALTVLVLAGARVGRMRQDKRQVGLTNAPPAARRVALVIGNGAYQNIRKLKNPANDAADMAAALQELGFELIGGAAQVNLTQRLTQWRGGGILLRGTRGAVER